MALWVKIIQLHFILSKYENHNDGMIIKSIIFILTVVQKGHVYYQFQHFQLPILNFLITNFEYGYFSLPLLNFLISDF